MMAAGNPTPSASAGERVLQKFMDRLASSLDPTPVSTKLYAQAVIRQESWEEARGQGSNYDRTLTLLEAVLRSVRADEQCFDKFCAVLREEEVTVGIAKELSDERDRILSGTQIQDEVLSSDPVVKTATSDKREEHNSTKRKNSKGDEDGTKRSVVLKKGEITGGDNFLMAIAREVGEKWEEVGIALEVRYKTLRSTVAKAADSEHMKAFHMLQEWSSRAADKFTYGYLASALEGAGLNTCARDYCYTPTSSSY